LNTAFSDQASFTSSSSRGFRVPVPVLAVLRGVGQVFFQENALTGLCFLIGIALSSPLMAVGALAGSIIGTVTARILNFDRAELEAGIYGFNATLVGIAAFFFFRPEALPIGLMVFGCITSTVATWLMRRYLPLPTYTTPFIVTTWAIYYLGLALGASEAAPGVPVESTSLAVAIADGVGQVMFQASAWTGGFFLIGIALNDRHHALWVLAGAVIGALVADYEVEVAVRSMDPDHLIPRAMIERIALGLYGYNATLTAIALYLWRRSLIPPILGILISVPLSEAFPWLGLPELTAPFVLATWIVLALGWLESNYLNAPKSAAP
jgi:urea transporter